MVSLYRKFGEFESLMLHDKKVFGCSVRTFAQYVKYKCNFDTSLLFRAHVY